MKDYIMLGITTFCITLVGINTQNKPVVSIAAPIVYVSQDSIMQDVRFKTMAIEKFLNNKGTKSIDTLKKN